MARLLLPMPLRPFAENQRSIEVQGTTVREALDDLLRRYPKLRPHLLQEDGQLQPYVHLFLNGEDIQSLQGLETPLPENAELRLLPSIAGGGLTRGCAGSLPGFRL